MSAKPENPHCAMDPLHCPWIMKYNAIPWQQIACRAPHKARLDYQGSQVLTSLPFIFGVTGAIKLHEIHTYNAVLRKILTFFARLGTSL